jgi:hypothetical protein
VEGYDPVAKLACPRIKDRETGVIGPSWMQLCKNSGFLLRDRKDLMLEFEG